MFQVPHRQGPCPLKVRVKRGSGEETKAASCVKRQGGNSEVLPGLGGGPSMKKVVASGPGACRKRTGGSTLQAWRETVESYRNHQEASGAGVQRIVG